MSDELRPCPFCGKDDEVDQYVTDGWGIVGCARCEMSFQDGGGNTENGARRWNNRPIEDRIAEENYTLLSLLNQHCDYKIGHRVTIGRCNLGWVVYRDAYAVEIIDEKPVYHPSIQEALVAGNRAALDAARKEVGNE